MKYIIMCAVLVVLLAVLIIIRIALKKGTIKALGLEDSTYSNCTLYKVIKIGEDSVFKNLPRNFSNLMVICSKNDEITLFIKNANKNYSLKYAIKFNREDIIKSSSNKSLNMNIYTVELKTGDIFELYINYSKKDIFDDILKANTN